MSKPNKRRIKMADFKAQVAEQVISPNGLIEVDLDDHGSIFLRVPLLPTDTDEDDFVQRMSSAVGTRDLALVALGEYDGTDAGEQWDKWEAAGYGEADFMILLRTETEAARERLGKFRYAG